jgi:hypothetical protein
LGSFEVFLSELFLVAKEASVRDDHRPAIT